MKRLATLLFVAVCCSGFGALNLGGAVTSEASPDPVYERMPVVDPGGADGCSFITCANTDLDEDPTGVGTDWAIAGSNNASREGHFTFDTPVVALTAGADLQEFRVSAREDVDCGTGQVTLRMELWEGGLIVRAGTAENVTAVNSCTQGTDCDVFSFTWNATEVSAAADVEVKIFGIKASGGGPVRCSVDIGAVDWNAYTALSACGEIWLA
jgi:hypothetical protein